MSLKPIKIAALVGSGIASGATFYISAFAIPAMLSPYSYKAEGQAILPAKALQMQWNHVYNTGKRFFPSLIVGTSALYLYLAYNVPDARPLYLSSACCMMSIVPYTLAVMMPNIRKIQTLEIKEEDEQDVLRLRDDIKTWTRLNYGRAVMQGVAFLAGAWAAVDSS